MLDRRRFVLTTLASPALTACGAGGDVAANRYVQTPLLASHARYGARFTQPGFVNGWGIAIRPAGAGGHFWIGGGGTSWQFIGDVARSADPGMRALHQDGLREVAVPRSDALTGDDSAGKVTGVVYNGAPLDQQLLRVRQQPAAGRLLEGSARFVFVTDSGSVSAWTERDAQTGAIVRVDGPAVEMFNGADQGMAFFGAAIHTGRWDRVWMADFGARPQIRTLDAQWQLVPTQGFANPFASGAAGEARPGDPVPFNIQVVNDGRRDRVFVLYAISQPDPDDPLAFHAGEEDALDAAAEAASGNRPARGRLAEFDLDGRLLRIYEDDGRLNAPWGVAIAPDGFGALAGHLLVGNFGGEGRICAFDLSTGRYVDDLRDAQHRPVAIPGLWALQFGNGVALGDSDALYFAAGPEDETEGLFGSLRLL
ncbi:TIGR03118 family protein [Delftia sp. WSY_14]|uniref:TIGR03118 family protein n=1 Tax=unclassified Delftia TaxID=2613839 RepID=UPI00370B2B05